MSDGGSLRVALLLHGAAPAPATAADHAGDLAAALRRRGATAHVLRPDAGILCAADAVLDRRGFAGPLSAVPLGLAALLRGRYDVVQAFSAVDAVAAIAWRRVTGRPVVFACLEPPGRGSVADRRLRLATLRRAVDDADAVVAATDETRDALARWLLVDAPVLTSGDAEAHERLYCALVAQRR